MTTNELIKLTKQLVAIPSTADNPRALRDAVNTLARMVAAHQDITIEGFERNGKPSFVAYQGHARPSKFDILLNAHIDVQPGLFVPVEKDGRLYGRGTLDMKGTAVVMTDVFCELVNKVPYKLGLEIVSDEEVGGYDGARLHIDEGLRSSFVICGEYADQRHAIYNAARGLCWAEIAFHGKEAHGDNPWKGDNAVVKAGNFAAAVLERYPTPEQETWTTTANISSLTTPNQSHNKVPDHAVLKIDFRFTQEDPVFENEDTLRAFIASIEPGAELVNLAAFEPAVNVESLNPYVQGLSRAMKRITKLEPKLLGRPAESDGRHFAQVNNDTVEYGLYGQNAHSDDEYVELDSFKEYQTILRTFLKTPTCMAQTNAVTKEVHRVEPLHVQLLRELISMPTLSNDFAENAKGLDYISAFLRKRGMYIEEFEREQFRSIVATTRPGAKEPTVMLSAHLDIVPGTADQFKLRTRGDKLLGRGTMDMKFAIAGYMALIDSMQDELSDYNVGIMITTDEELGSSNGASRLILEYGYKPSVAIVPDGGENWRLEVFSKGVHWIELHARGQNGHASRPWEGDSAIDRLLETIQEIQTLVPVDPKPEETFLSVGTIKGGTMANQIPTHASAVLDVRYGNIQDFFRLPTLIKSVAEKHDVRMHITCTAAPTSTDPKNQYVKSFVDITSRITGNRHDNSFSFGSSDARYFGAAGVPCIVISPPAGNRHKDGEWLSRIGFDQFMVVLEEYVRRVADLKPDRKAAKQRDVARLAKRLNASSKPAYVWYATYGSGLSRENFLCYVTGGKPTESTREQKGCRDKSLPVKDTFMSLPYELQFAGDSVAWDGPQAILSTAMDKNAHTIGRAYLITVEQFEDIAAQENLQSTPVRLPLAMAIRDGHVSINNITGKRLFDELMYCGLESNIPVFTLTSLRDELPSQGPSERYTKLLCAGLSQDPDFVLEDVIDYLSNISKFNKGEIGKMFEDLSVEEQ